MKRYYAALRNASAPSGRTAALHRRPSCARTVKTCGSLVLLVFNLNVVSWRNIKMGKLQSYEEQQYVPNIKRSVQRKNIKITVLVT